MTGSIKKGAKVEFIIFPLMIHSNSSCLVLREINKNHQNWSVVLKVGSLVNVDVAWTRFEKNAS